MKVGMPSKITLILNIFRTILKKKYLKIVINHLRCTGLVMKDIFV